MLVRKSELAAELADDLGANREGKAAHAHGETTAQEQASRICVFGRRSHGLLRLQSPGAPPWAPRIRAARDQSRSGNVHLAFSEHTRFPLEGENKVRLLAAGVATRKIPATIWFPAAPLGSSRGAAEGGL